MSAIDIRVEDATPVTEIIFGDSTDRSGTHQAFTISTGYRHYGAMAIRDAKDFVLVDTKERAENLIKALQKAIELEWVK